MTTLLIALGAMLGGGGVVAIIGHARLRALRGEHRHIWSPWSDCQPTDKPTPWLVESQKRECLDCGLKEVRQVQP